jgi:hypothetical protein
MSYLELEEISSMIRKALPLLFLAVAFFIPSRATQAQVQLFGGYSFEHYDTSPSFNTNGWEISGQYKVIPWLGAFADIDGHYGTFDGVSSTEHNFLFGPQVSFPARVSPFAHVVIGGAHASAGNSTSTSFASGFGFGIDTKVAPAIAWRIVQFDFIHTHLYGGGESNTRVSTGIVFNF